VTQRSHQEQTFVRLYEEHYQAIHAFCERRVGRNQADDSAAEVFTVVWRRLGETTVTSERAWVYSIARNVVRNRWRSARRSRSLVQRVAGFRQDQPQTPEVLVVRSVHDEQVVDALSGLNEADRELLMLSAWDGLSGSEIASVLNISDNAVHQRLFRAKKRLAASIARHHPELVEQLDIVEGGS